MYSAILKTSAPRRLATLGVRCKATQVASASSVRLTSDPSMGRVDTPHVLPSEAAKHHDMQNAPHRITAMNSYEVTAPHHRTTKNSDGDYMM
jgi:hypothetical protein